MREHSDYFKQFLSIPAAPKKKKKTKKSAAAGGGGGYQPPSESAIDAEFAQHLKRMSQQGVYGDNIEICAFARRYNCDVKIYQREFAYVVVGGNGGGDGGGDGGQRKLVHIAYHTWEHYSSIRNLAGPYAGLPDVKPIVPNPTADSAAAAVEAQKGKEGRKYALPWMVDTVMLSLPFLATEEEVAKALEECKGDVNEAVGRMLDQQSTEEAGTETQCPAVADPGDKDAPLNKDSGGCGGDASPTPGTAGNEEAPPTPEPTEPIKGNQASPPPKNKAAASANGKNANGNPTPPKHPPKYPKLKRETARERKERQKAAAKERKTTKTAKGAGEVKDTVKDKAENRNRSTENDNIDGGIRELYI